MKMPAVHATSDKGLSTVPCTGTILPHEGVQTSSENDNSTSVNSFMIMPNGAATAVAQIDASMTPETAETWMKTDQYIKLRALLTSLRYAA